MSGVEQNIKVNIKAIVDGLKSVQELQTAVKALHAQGNKKLGVDAKGTESGVFKLITVVRQLSPALDGAASRAQELTGALAGGSGLLATLGPLGALLGVLAGGGLTVAGVLFKVTRDAAEAANRIGELQDKTGLTAETLSALSLAAENTDSNVEQFADGVVKLNRTIADAGNNSEEAKRKLKLLGIEPGPALKDLDGALGQALKKIADAPNAAEAARLAVTAFGKSGAELLPTIKSFDGDLTKAKQTAADFGRLLSNDAVRAAREFDDNLDSIHATATGLEAQLGNRLVPEFNKLFRLLNSESRNSSSIVGLAFDDIAGKVRASTNALLVFLAALKTIQNFKVKGENLAALLSPEPGVRAAAQSALEGNFNTDFEGNLAELLKAANTPLSTEKPGTTKPSGGKGGESLRERMAALWRELSKSQGEVTAAGEESRAADIKDLLDREKAAIAAQLEERLISYREYYTRLAQIETDAIDQEIIRQQQALDKINQELAQKKAEIGADKKLTPGERVLKETTAANEAEAKTVPILQKIEELGRDREAVVGRTRGEIIKTAEAAQKEADAVQRQLDLLSNSASVRTDAALGEIKARFAETRRQLIDTFGEASAEVATLDELIARLGDRSQFEEVSKKFQQAMERLRNAEALIDADQEREGFSDEEAQRRKLEVQRQIRKEVFDTLSGLEVIAQRTGDREMQNSVAQLRIEWEKLGVKIDEVGRSINEDIKQGLKDTLASVIRDVHNAGDAILSLVNHILDRISALLADRIVEGIFGPGGPLAGVLGGNGQNGSAGGLGGILSKILGFPGTQGNPRTSSGTVTVQGGTPPFAGSNFLGVLGAIQNFQAGTTAGLNSVNNSTRGVAGEVYTGFQSASAKIQEIISFLPNLLPAQTSWWRQALVAAIGAVASAAVGSMGQGSDGGGGSVPVPEPGEWPKFNSGGLINGPGTGTSDSIPARLSNGEFVMRAAAVKSIGADVLSYMNNLGRLPTLQGFNGGGPVGFNVSEIDLSASPLMAALRDSSGREGAAAQVKVTIVAKDVQSFRGSEQQIKRDMARAVQSGVQRATSHRK